MWQDVLLKGVVLFSVLPSVADRFASFLLFVQLSCPWDLEEWYHMENVGIVL